MLHPILSTLALINLVVAASSSASCSFSTKITSPTDIAQLSQCTALSGTIEIGGSGIGSIDLSGVEEIKGDVKLFNSSSVTNINLNSLKKISGSLSVIAYTQLFSIDLTSLTEVKDLSLVSLPSLVTLNLNAGVENATSIEISDTALHGLAGLINFSKIESLDINNNKNISEINFPSLLSVSDSLSLSFNSDSCDIKLDSLSSASNLTVQDVSSFSASNLTSVNGSLVIGYNTFDNLVMNHLKTVGSLKLFANNDLTNADFSKLTLITGELFVSNNTVWDNMKNSFKNLTTIEGALQINGDIANFTLPSLKVIDGDFTFSTTNEDFDCSDFNALQKGNKILGHNYNCTTPKKAEVSSKGGSSTSSKSDSTSSSSSTSSSTPKKSEGTFLIGPVVLVAFAMAAGAAIIA